MKRYRVGRRRMKMNRRREDEETFELEKKDWTEERGLQKKKSPGIYKRN